MRIAMIGAGYVGLVSGACFSDFGHIVSCLDKDAAKIRELQKGKLPIFEPGLDAIVASNVAAGRLSFASQSAAAVRAADAVFLAVKPPDMGGYDCYRRFRELRPAATPALTMEFGYDEHHVIPKARQDGLRHVLFKPFREEQVVRAVLDPAPQTPPPRPEVAGTT